MNDTNKRIDDAEELFSDFSGHDLDQMFEVEMNAPDGEVIFAFGILSCFESKNGEFMEFEETPPLLCASADGEQLYVFSESPIAEELPKSGVILAAVEYATYRNGEYDLYRHEFDTEQPPVLKSDSNGKLIIEGGICYFDDHGIID